MANYNTLEELVSTISNATRLLENQRYDDNSYTDWLPSSFSITWNGLTISDSAPTIINGNSYIQFSTLTFGINQRDAAMTDLWREIGVVGKYNFLRYRWKGTAYYSGSEPYVFDLILVENNRAYLYIVDSEISSYIGVTDITYNSTQVQNSVISDKLETDASYTWYPGTEGDITSITYHEGLDSFQEIKYLVKNKSDNKVYTYSSNAWVEVTANISLASTFSTYGMDKLPSNLPTEFELLKWVDLGDLGTSIVVEADLNATDSDNSITYHVELPSATSIRNIIADTDGTIEYSNNGSTWSNDISSISDVTDFFVRIVLGSYFAGMNVLYL